MKPLVLLALALLALPALALLLYGAWLRAEVQRLRLRNQALESQLQDQQGIYYQEFGPSQALLNRPAPPPPPPALVVL